MNGNKKREEEGIYSKRRRRFRLLHGGMSREEYKKAPADTEARASPGKGEPEMKEYAENPSKLGPYAFAARAYRVGAWWSKRERAAA